MKIFIVNIEVKPECQEAFIEVSKENARGSRLEAGNIRFDVLQDSDNPNVFRLYEAWKDDDAIAAHRDAPHYIKWNSAVADMMATPRSKTVNTSIDFTE